MTRTQISDNHDSAGKQKLPEVEVVCPYSKIGNSTNKLTNPSSEQYPCLSNHISTVPITIYNTCIFKRNVIPIHNLDHITLVVYIDYHRSYHTHDLHLSICTFIQEFLMYHLLKAYQTTTVTHKHPTTSIRTV